MCYKNQHKRHIRISPLSPLTHARNIGHTDAIGTSSVGCAVNSIQTACRSSCVYINVGASNNNNNDSNSNNSCMYETSATSIRKALGVTACRSSRFTSTSEPRITTTTTHFNGSDGQKHGKNQGCQGWLLEEGALTCKFDDFRGLVSTYAAGGSRGSSSSSWWWRWWWCCYCC